MSDSIPNISNNVSENPQTSDSKSLAEIRSLLLGLDQSELDNLHERLRNPKVSPEDLSRILPEAIMLRSMQDHQLSEAMVPTVEEAIQASVKKDLTVLSDAIFPVIGPSTRKAISTTLEAMVESLNQTIEHSFSLQSFKWRLEALQTGKSFAEVVLLRTLLYRVEQVFLIHKKTGLLLQHLVAPRVAAQDPDLVSAMLTAIQNFAQDSFSVQNSDVLDTLHFGELAIWIEQGPQSILACVIRGHPPQELKLVFKDALERIYLKHSQALNSFNGDTSPFEASKPYLEACLQARYKRPKGQQTYRYLWLYGGIILLALGGWGFSSIQAHRHWIAYLEKLQSEPGIVVTTAKRGWGTYFISGLRDPLSADPITIMKEAELNSEAVVSEWKPYYSLEPEFVEARVKQLLQPPGTISLSVGKDGILNVQGSAPQQWIIETRKLVRVIPGITQFQENIAVTELSQLEFSKKQIEQQVFQFIQGKTQLIPGQGQTLQKLAQEIKSIFKTAQILEKSIQIHIIGRADAIGDEQQNRILSQARASAIRAALVANGIPTTNFRVVGMGSQQPLRQGTRQQEIALNRSVSFKVILNDSANSTPSYP